MPAWLKYLLEGGFIIGAARFGWTAFLQWQRTRNERKAVKQLKGVDDINSALKQLIDDTPADYAQIVHVHNGGNELSASLPIFMSVRHEKTGFGFFPLKDSLQSLPIDDHYRGMVAQLVNAKDGHAEVSEYDDKTLNAIWTHMKAKYARSILLSVGKKGVFFLRTTSSTKPLDESNNLQFSRCIATLKKYY